MIGILRAASALATRAIDQDAVTRVVEVAKGAARTAATVAATILRASESFDGSRPPPSRRDLSLAEVELLDAAVSVPDDDRVASAADPAAAARDAFRATIRLVEAAAALRAERRDARRGVSR